LAALQTDWRISNQALYHLTKAERLKPEREDEKVAIAATKFVAYKQVGMEKEADMESEKIRKMDPAVYERLRTINPAVLKPSATERPRVQDPAGQRLRTTDPSPERSRVEQSTIDRSRISQPPRTATPDVIQERRTTDAVRATTEPATVRPSLRTTTRTRSLLAPIVVEVSSEPSSVTAGAWTTIRITATQDGQPLPGADVRASVNGGLFRGTQNTQSTGATDADGVFETSWSCQPCATAYDISVAVSKDGLTAGKADFTVKIQ
jgi:hypothetical protein